MASPTSVSHLPYFIPNLSIQRLSPSQPLTPPLISVPSSLELATRLCRILVRRLGGERAVYLGCSITEFGMGCGVEEGLGVVGVCVGEVVRLISLSDDRKVDG